MPDPHATALQAAVDAYLGAPTREHYQQLVDQAQAYHEHWVEAHTEAAGAETRRPNAGLPAWSDERELEVTEFVYEIPITLALQERAAAAPAERCWVLGWRTRTAPDGDERRFYWTKDGCWTIPPQIALEMLQIMEGRGGLAAHYHDPRLGDAIRTSVSSHLSTAEKRAALDGVTAADEDWGPDPQFVITHQHAAARRHVLLIHAGENLATFRTITEDPQYLPKKTLRPGANWWLDNSMMDASVQEMKIFCGFLAEYCAQRDQGPHFPPE